MSEHQRSGDSPARQSPIQPSAFSLQPSSFRLAFLASHRGSNVQAIVDACREGRLRSTPAVVISNNSGSLALDRARAAGIPTHHLSSQTHPGPGALDTAILEVLDAHGANLVILAGYMKRLGPLTIARFRNRILNTHPALLPKFGGQGMYGEHVHRAVLESGDPVSGITIHLVDEEYDHGAIVGQSEVPVEPGDTVETLTERVQTRERAFFVETLARIERGDLDLDRLSPSH